MAIGKGILWKGKYFVKPQAASYIDSSALSPIQLGNGNKVAIIGDMTGLIPPKTLMSVTPSTALEIIHPDCEHARLASDLVFNPSKGGVGGANNVYLISPQPTTQASATNAGYTISSYMYGVYGNQIKVKQEVSSTKTTVVVTYKGNIESFTNIEKPSFSIIYTGSGSACTMSINLTTKKLTTTCTGATSDNLDISFETFDTISELTDAISASGKYTVIVKCSQPSIDKCIELDGVTSADIKTSAVIAYSNLQAVVDTINSKSGYIQATRVDGATGVPAAYEVNLAGGTSGTTDGDDWQEVFDVLKTADIQILLLLTEDESLWAKGETHCQLMSNPFNKKERVQFIGGLAKTGWQAAVTRASNIDALCSDAKTLNSDRTVCAGLGSKHYNSNGEVTLYPAYITAAMYAGLAAGSNVTTPLTRKYLNCLGLEVDLRSDEIDELIEAGVACPIPDTVQDVGYVISRGVTTWSGDADLLKIELSVRRGADYVAREVRNRHEIIIGSPGTEAIDVTIVNMTNAVLDAAKREEIIRSYDPQKTQIRAVGVTRYVDYSAVPILPINWIFSTYHLQPLNITISL